MLLLLLLLAAVAVVAVVVVRLGHRGTYCDFSTQRIPSYKRKTAPEHVLILQPNQ
jgi:hypothetical protein